MSLIFLSLTDWFELLVWHNVSMTWIKICFIILIITINILLNSIKNVCVKLRNYITESANNIYNHSIICNNIYMCVSVYVRVLHIFFYYRFFWIKKYVLNALLSTHSAGTRRTTTFHSATWLIRFVYDFGNATCRPVNSVTSNL